MESNEAFEMVGDYAKQNDDLHYRINFAISTIDTTNGLENSLETFRDVLIDVHMPKHVYDAFETVWDYAKKNDDLYSRILLADSVIDTPNGFKNYLETLRDALYDVHMPKHVYDALRVSISAFEKDFLDLDTK